MGPTEHRDTSPKLSSAACLSFLIEEIPTPMAMINGTVIGPVVTPPESNATAINSFGTKNDIPISARYSTARIAARLT